MTEETYSETDQEMFDEDAEFDELLDGDDIDEQELPEQEEMPELTLEGLASGVQNALNSIVDGTTREFDRLNGELDKLKKEAGKAEGYMEGKLEEFDKRMSNTKDRLLKIERAVKTLSKRVKKLS